MSEETKGAEPGKVPTSRILISIAGLILGIVASFFITGLGSYADVQKGGGKNPPAVSQAKPATPEPAAVSSNAVAATEPQVMPFSWRRFWTVSLISLAICGLSYQGLYFSLRLYQREPTFLILFVAFQYGYFWQSALKGASALLK